MNPRRRLLTLLIAAVLAITIFGCGVKVEDGGGSSDVTVVDESTTTGDSGEDSTTQVTGTDQTAGTAITEPATTEPDDTSPPSLPPGVDEEQIKDQLATGFKTLGLNDKEAKCLADAYIREFGVTTGTPDTTKIIDLFGECNIDPTKIGAGGGG